MTIVLLCMVHRSADKASMRLDVIQSLWPHEKQAKYLLSLLLRGSQPKVKVAVLLGDDVKLALLMAGIRWRYLGGPEHTDLEYIREAVFT